MNKDNIVLIGMPGVGKSTVGVVLAKNMGYSFVDSDLLIQEQEGKLLHEIIAERGLDGFNEVEDQVNASININRAIIATGGSVVYGEQAMEHLKKIGTVVYLSLPYYPLQSLHHFYDCRDSAEAMQRRHADFPATVTDTLGAVEVSHKGERFCFVIPEAGTEYVHTQMKENEFIRQLVELVGSHGTTMEQIKALFEAQNKQCVITDMDSDEFDVLMRFTEGDDPYYYCFKDEGCHIIYHRFLPEDYADFGFEKSER